MNKVFLSMLSGVLTIGFLVSSCKKNNNQPQQQQSVPPPGGGNNNTPNTSPYPYYISYKDSGNYRVYQLSGFSQTGNDNNGSTAAEHIAYYTKALNPFTGYRLKLFLPIDSSGLINMIINKKYITKRQTWSFGSVLTSSVVGDIDFVQTSGSAAVPDNMINQIDTLNYFNKIDSVKFTNTYVYEGALQQMLAVFVVKGRFKVRISQSGIQDRDWADGEYRLKINVRRQ